MNPGQKQRWKSLLLSPGVMALMGGLPLLAAQELLTPPAAQAYEARLSVTIDQEPNETYQTLVKRAEIVARAAVQRAFDTDILASDALIFINARRGGWEAPLLSVAMSRFQWKSFPDARRWATYYPSTQSLLRLDTPVEAAPTAATPVNATTTPSAAPSGTPATPPSGSSTPNTGTKTPFVPRPFPLLPTLDNGGATTPNPGTVPQSIQLTPPDTIRPITVPITSPTNGDQ